MSEITNDKDCFKCGIRKPLDEFYKHKQMGDGHLNKCKTCTRKDTADRVAIKSNDPEWVFKERERHRLKAEEYSRERGVLPFQESLAIRRIKSEQHKIDFAHMIKYKKAACVRAGRKVDCPSGSHRHHWSYNKDHWECVFIVDILFHNKIHRYTNYDDERRMYRTVHGTLLDSRELCEKYYNILKTIEDGKYSELKKLF